MLLQNHKSVGILAALGILLLLIHRPLVESLERNLGFLQLNDMVLPSPSALTADKREAIFASFQSAGVEHSLGEGMLELFSGNCAGALPRLQDYLTAHPTDQITAYWIGQCESQSGNWESAIQVWKTARLLRPLQDAGNVFASQQNWQLASEAYQAVVTLAPHDCEYRAHAVSAAWWATLDASSSIAQIERVITECPDDVEGYLVLGRILIETGQFSDAELYLSTARALAPTNDSTLVNLALLRLRENRASDAFTLLQSAMRMNPTRADTFALLGSDYSALGQSSQAVQAYETAVRLAPNQAWIYEELGAAFEAVGEKDNARAAYQEALALDPNRLGARARLAKLGLK